MKVWGFALGFLAVAIFIAFVLSPYASSFPDGLEWAAGKLGFEHRAEGAEVIKSAPMPDYTVPSVKSESTSTRLAGLAGTVIVFGVGVALGALLKARRKEAAGQ